MRGLPSIDKIRDGYNVAKEEAIAEGRNDAWQWERYFAKYIIEKSVQFLKDNNSDFEAEQLNDFWSEE